MTKRTSLMEWLEQTKKIAKSVDYIAMDVIDNILCSLWLVDKKVLLAHKAFFDKLCTKYHKPNPINYIKSKKMMGVLFSERYGSSLQDWIKKLLRGHDKHCRSFVDYKSCSFNKYGIKIFSEFINNSIKRCEKAQQEILWQWFEVIDFMYERPELINPSLIDEYIENSINEVCENNKKNNPLTNGMRKRFGKYWWNAQLKKWCPEKRNRF